MGFVSEENFCEGVTKRLIRIGAAKSAPYSEEKLTFRTNE